MAEFARKVVTPTGRRIRGYFPSRKTGRMVSWESKLEYDAILHFEFSPWIASFREQPERVIFYIDGEPQVYFPDFEIVLTEGEIAHVEIKPQAKLRKLKHKAKYEAIAGHYARINRSFRILTENEIRVEPKLANLKKLKYHNRQGDIADGALETWCRSVLESNAATVEQACEVLGGDLKKVYRLIAAGYLICDLNKPLGLESGIGFSSEVKRSDQIFI